MTDPLMLLVAFLVAVVGIARAVRLVTSDAYPPMEWLRLRWSSVTANRGPSWEPLMTCPFCVSPYITAVAMGVAYWGGIWTPDLHTVAGWWWLLAVWATVSYLSAMVVLRDEPPPVDE